MKKYILLILLALFYAYSCDNNDDEKGSIEAVTDVTCSSFIGSVTLNWKNASNPDYYYTLITYLDSEGNTINKKVSRFSSNDNNETSVIAGGFKDTKEYEFTLTAHGYSGASSSPIVIKGTPLDIEEAKDYVMETVIVEPATVGAAISWTNETGVPVSITATYKDRKNVQQTVKIDASQSGKRFLTGIIETTDIRVVAANINGGSKSEEKIFTITPDIDPYDVIHDDVDYITFGWGDNQLSYTQDNVDNPYEYTFTTQGGDPYVYCNGMKVPIKGRTLIFRYRSTAAFNLELFWCNAGGGAAGGRSTTVSVEKNDSEEWKTFKFDYSDAMSTHSWAGNDGDFCRFDWGNTPGVIINVKNIHFE